MAWADLMEKRKNKKRVNSNDIKKHKNDIVRLNEILTEEDILYISQEIYNAVRKYIDAIKETFSQNDIRNIIKKRIDKDLLFNNIITKFKVKPEK